MGDLSKESARKTHKTPEEQVRYLQTVIDSFQHPFYVVDAEDFTIRLANAACKFGSLAAGPKCYEITHKRANPCVDEHICPLQEVKKTKKSVVTEHIHYDHAGQPQQVEVHGDPIMDDQGNVIMMVEYVFDISERRKAEEAVRQKVASLEALNKVMLGREARIFELKQEINGLLKSIGQLPKYEA